MRLEGNYRLVLFLGLGLALSAVQVLASTGLLAPPPAVAQTNPTTVTFRYTGGPQTWTVPPGVTGARFDVFGAQGGLGCNDRQRLGGLGGQATATLAVSAGQVVHVNVGGAGGDAGCQDQSAGAGGFNGGGVGGGGVGGGGGGGASDIGTGSLELVAGGGGGSGGPGGGPNSLPSGGAGGGGGGGTGNGGMQGDYGNGGSSGGAGGAGATGDGVGGFGGGGQGNVCSGDDGGPGSGNTGGTGAGGTDCTGGGGGGGGGGYFGGGGGGQGGYGDLDGGDSGTAAGGGGGGGSGYGPPGTTFATGVQSGDGAVTITYMPQSTPTPTANPTATATPTVPATATPTPTATTTATPTHPAGQVTAHITGCSAQGGDVYACALQVRLGPALPVNTVFSVDINSAFANPSGGDRPEVTSSPGCEVPPLASPYLATGDRYTRYQVNISTGGCQARAEVTFREAVAGTAGATITQAVTVPGFNTATATFVLPAAAATSTATPRPATMTATPTATPPRE